MGEIRSLDGTTIAFTRNGDGPPVILVGGAFQVRNDPKMVALGERLASAFTVLRYDRRGRGDSGDTLPYAPDREIEDLAAIVDVAGGKSVVFGMSSGAVLALRAAAQGVPITTLALYEPPFVVDTSRTPRPPDHVHGLTELLQAGRRGDAVALFMTDVVNTPAEFVDGMREMPFWPAMEQLAHTLPYDGAIMADTMSGKPTLPRDWTATKVPTLVVDGGASPAWLRAAADRLADALPMSRRQTLVGQDHDVDPEILGDAVHQFFAEQSGPR